MTAIERFRFPDLGEIKGKGGIYRITNNLNDLKYIGQAKDFFKRFVVHMSNFRKNKNSKYLQRFYNAHPEVIFTLSVVEYCGPHENLFIREQAWMDEEESYIKGKGFNISITADSSLGHFEEGRNLTEMWDEDMRERSSDALSVDVEHLDKEGNVISYFSSAAKALNLEAWQVRRVCQGIKARHGIRLRYVESPERAIGLRRLEIFLINNNDEVLEKFDDISDAVKKFGIERERIRQVCAGDFETTFGMRFRFADEKKHEESQKKQKKYLPSSNYGNRKQEIEQCDILGNFIKRFSSITEASKILSLDGSAISKTVRGKLNQTGGFIFRRVKS